MEASTRIYIPSRNFNSTKYSFRSLEIELLYLIYSIHFFSFRSLSLFNFPMEEHFPNRFIADAMVARSWETGN